MKVALYESAEDGFLNAYVLPSGEAAEALKETQEKKILEVDVDLFWGEEIRVLLEDPNTHDIVEQSLAEMFAEGFRQGRARNPS